MTAQLGQTVALKTQTSPTRVAFGLITKIISGDTVNLTALIDDTDDWPAPTYVPSSHPAWLFESVAKGTGVGEWQDVTLSDVQTAAIAAAVSGLATAAAVTVIPIAGTSRSITIGTDFQATDTSRPARFTISGTWSQALSLTGSIAGTVQLKAGASSNPSAVVDDAQPGLSATLALGVALTPTVPWKLAYDLPAGHFARVVVASGSGFAITHCNETPL